MSQSYVRRPPPVGWNLTLQLKPTRSNSNAAYAYAYQANDAPSQTGTSILSELLVVAVATGSNRQSTIAPALVKVFY